MKTGTQEWKKDSRCWAERETEVRRWEKARAEVQRQRGKCDEKSKSEESHKQIPSDISFSWSLMILFCPKYLTIQLDLLIIPAWKIPWTEEPGRLQSMGSLRVGHD